MTKISFLSAALVSAILLTTPAMARHGKPNLHRPITTTAQSVDGQICCRDRASDLHGPAERDVWGHWGSYYGPMVFAA